MNRAVVSSIVAAAAVVTLLVPTFAGAADTNKDVRVINTPAEAVPVAPQGTTQIAGSVNIGNTPGVQIANENPIEVNDVSADVLEPFVAGIGEGFQFVLIPDGALVGSDDFTVPEGKILVIEQVSGHLNLPSGQSPAVIDVRVDGGPGVFLSAVLMSASENRYQFGGEVRLYAGSGETVEITVGRDDNNGQALYEYGLFGYLVNA